MSFVSHQLDAFLEVARTGSFSQAARRLRLTQSALSQRVLNLEAELGQTLLLREPAGLRLTEAGETLLRYCGVREALEAEVRARISAAEGRGALSGRVRLGGFSTVVRSVLVPALSPLLRANPEVVIETLSREVGALANLLKSGEADLIVLDRPLTRAGVSCSQLGHETYVLVESRAHTSPQDLFLDHDPDDETTERFFEAQRRKPPRLRRRFLDEIYGVIDGAAAGLGRAVVPLHLVRADSRLRIVKGLKPLVTPVYLCHYEQPYYTALQTAVLDALRQGATRLLGS